MKILVCPECGCASLYDGSTGVTHIKCVSCGKTYCFNDMEPRRHQSTIETLYAKIQEVGDNSGLTPLIENLSRTYGVDKRVLADLANMCLSQRKKQSPHSMDYGFSVIKETEITLDDVIERQKKLEMKLEEAMTKNEDVLTEITGLGEKELNRQLLLVKAEKERIEQLYQKAKLEITALKSELKKYK